MGDDIDSNGLQGGTDVHFLSLRSFVRGIRAVRPNDYGWQTAALGSPRHRIPGWSAALRTTPNDVIALHSGYPDRELLPERLVRAAFARAARSEVVVSRPPGAGLPELQSWFAGELGALTPAGLTAPSARDVVILPGSQSGLGILVNALAAELVAQPPYDLLVRFAALTGLRAGEVAALRIRDIDLRRGEVQVKLNKTHTSKGYITGAPKTARAVRAVPILDEGLFRDIGVYLRNHPHRDDLEADLWPGKVPGHRKVSYEYAFDPKGFYRYTFKPACDRAGLRGLHFHELRHTFATLALESGALDMHELSRAMGHASYAITDKVYAHLRPRDYSRHRAAFSAHIAAGTVAPAPIVAIGV
ncbi:tyrosine-type recombinase/integrase [Microbacterium aurum]|uniref:tyrosine-type recombinase/integrase n=1 Tax=Microbacterium aurum TaxID=36805 RepID=UPI0018DE8C3E|nr:tyrosine-type recombinase/integrase [Microbacterium aurum]